MSFIWSIHSDAWSLHSSVDELKWMAKDRLARGEFALYIADESDHEDLITMKGFVDILSGDTHSII